jgi:hypothetical protein
VIDGTLAVEGHLLGPGDYFAAAGGTVHGAVSNADGAGDFCGTVTGTTPVTDSPEGGLLLALGARGVIAREADS